MVVSCQLPTQSLYVESTSMHHHIVASTPVRHGPFITSPLDNDVREKKENQVFLSASHIARIQRRSNVDVRPRRYIDVGTTLPRHHLPAGCYCTKKKQEKFYWLCWLLQTQRVCNVESTSVRRRGATSTLMRRYPDITYSLGGVMYRKEIQTKK